MVPCLTALTFVWAISLAPIPQRLLLHAMISEIACFARKPSMVSSYVHPGLISCPQQSSGKA